MSTLQQTGFGGSCHWCTEAIFSSLRGVHEVQQGWIAADAPNDIFSEAVIVLYDPSIIPLETLIAVHLYTHSCTSQHRFRSKYRSAVYTFNAAQATVARKAIEALQGDFQAPIITQILPFNRFTWNMEHYRNYYFSDPAKPFCENFIHPKLKLLLQRFPAIVDTLKLSPAG